MPLSISPEAIVLDTDAACAAQAWLVGPEGLDSLPPTLGEVLRDASGFKAKAGQSLTANGEDGLVIAVGLGDDIDLKTVRSAAGTLAGVASRIDSVAVNFAEAIDSMGGDDAVRAVTEGLLLGSYRFVEHKSSDDEPPALSAASLVSADGSDGLTRGRATGAAVAFARELVNEPGGTLTSTVLGERALAMAAEVGIEAEAWGPDRIREERLGGILAVNQGSVEEPRLIKLTHKPEGATKKLAFVGKGITFDSGGLSIKPADGMMTMKCDMGGAAAVLGAMMAIGTLAPNVEVTCFVVSTDNMTGGAAIRPGDVFTARNGKTVEVLNTDAEGRLVLADGLSLAAELEPDVIVDCATLTGACMVALGGEIAGHMGNNDELNATVLGAAADAGETAWGLPLHKGYREQLDSKVADLKNIGAGRYGGAITAGLFLQEFVDDTPWVHIDLAGPAFGDKAAGEISVGGSGYGVMTLVELAIASADD